MLICEVEELAMVSTLSAVPESDRKIIDGRAHVNRAMLRELTGMSEARQAALYGERATNGHPKGVQIGRGLYFDEEQALAFHHGMGESRREALSEVDRGGDPEELLDTAGATKLLGYTNTSTIRGYLVHNPGYFPEPDEVEETLSGRQRRWWKRRTLWKFADNRIGRGGLGYTKPRRADQTPAEAGSDVPVPPDEP